MLSIQGFFVGHLGGNQMVLARFSQKETLKIRNTRFLPATIDTTIYWNKTGVVKGTEREEVKKNKGQGERRTGEGGRKERGKGKGEGEGHKEGLGPGQLHIQHCVWRWNIIEDRCGLRMAESSKQIHCSVQLLGLQNQHSTERNKKS